jgi:HD-like signal output (HDOD) protein
MVVRIGWSLQNATPRMDRAAIQRLNLRLGRAERRAVNIIRQQTNLSDAHAAVCTEMSALLQYGRLDLPPLPERAARVLALAGRRGADAQGLTQIIASDPALAAKVLKVARCAAYRPSCAIDSLPNAIGWLGVGEVADIAFTAAVQGCLLPVQAQRARAERTWRVAVAAAIWSREVAAMARRPAEMIYLCGLFHDIGRAAALLAIADVAGKLGVRLDDEQYDRLIHDFHGPLGALLAARWQLPESVAECMRAWPEPAEAPGCADPRRVVHVAHHVAELIVGQGAEMAREALSGSAVLDQLNIGPDRLKALVDRSDWVMGQVSAY